MRGGAHKADAAQQPWLQAGCPQPAARPGNAGPENRNLCTSALHRESNESGDGLSRPNTDSASIPLQLKHGAEQVSAAATQVCRHPQQLD